MSRTIILLEFLEDAAEAEAVRIGASERGEIVPLSAEAADWVWSTRLRPEGDLPFTGTSMDDELSLTNLDNLPSLVTALDHAGVRIFAESAPGYLVGTCHMARLHTLLDSLAFRCSRLADLLGKVRPDRVVYFAPSVPTGPGLYYERHESIWADVARAAARSTVGESMVWEERRSGVSEQSLSARVTAAQPGGWWKARVRRSLTLQSIARRLRSLTGGAPRTPNRTLAAGREATPVLIVGDDPELSRLAPQMKARGFRVWHWRSCAVLTPDVENRDLQANTRLVESSRDVKVFLDSVFENGSTLGMFSWRGIDCGLAVKGRLAAFASGTMFGTASAYMQARQLIRRIRPRVVLHGEVGGDVWKRAVLDAAGAEGAQRWFLQWGGNYGYAIQPYVGRVECRSEVFGAYTQTVADEIGRTAELAPSVKRVVTGSPYFADLAGRIQARRDRPARIVYVLSLLAGNLRYGPYLCLDDAPYHAFVREVVRVLAVEFPGRVCVKLHPWNILAADPIRGWLRRQRLPISLSAAPLETLLDESSVWVLDNHATCLQQVAVTRDPVIYLNTGGSRLSDLGERTVRSLACFIEGRQKGWEGELTRAVRTYLCGQAAEPSAEFTEFLVGGPEHGGSDLAANRTLTFLRKSFS